MTQEEKNQITVRFPPSPTGKLHIGGVRTALFNYLFAKKNEGRFILRIEDTDRERFDPEATAQIIQTLAAYGLLPENLDVKKVTDAPAQALPEEYFQSNRLEKYQQFAEKLLEKGHAYEAFDTPEELAELRKQQQSAKQQPKYDRRALNLTEEEKQKMKAEGRPRVIRLKIPEGETEFEDLIFGKIKVNNQTLDDQILLKSDGFPTYHLANVVDDHDMSVTHVIRGEEWVPSTPKHVILYQMLGWELPKFAHLPLITKPGGKKLSKRDSAADASRFLEFFEPAAVLNYIAFLGWNPKTEQEIFTKDELIEDFALEKVNRASAVFDEEKLNWINQRWVKKITTEQSLAETVFYQKFTQVVEANYTDSSLGFTDNYLQSVASLVLERVRDFWQIEELLGSEFEFFFKEKLPEYDPEAIVWKKSSREQTRVDLRKLIDFLLSQDLREVGQEELEEKTKTFLAKEGIGLGDALYPLRYALSGLKNSPGPFEIIQTLNLLPKGKEVIQERVERAIENLG